MANLFCLLVDEDDGSDVASSVERFKAEQKAAKQREEDEKKAAQKAAEEERLAAEKAAAEKKAAAEVAVKIFDFGSQRVRGRSGRGNFHGGREGMGYRGNFYGGRGGRGYYNRGENVGFRNGNNENQHRYQNSHGLGNGAEMQHQGSTFYANSQDGTNNVGFRVQSSGGRNGQNQSESNYEAQSVDIVNNSSNGDGDSERITPETAEVPKEGPTKEITEEEKRKQKRRERLKKEWEEDAKKLTLRQYEEQLRQKRMELTKKIEKGERTLEALKTQERKILVEKEFEGMQLVVKRDEDNFIKLKSGKEKLKRSDSLEKEKLKRNDSLEKEEEIHKPNVTSSRNPRPEWINRGRVNGQEDRNVTTSGYPRPERINRGRVNGQEVRSVTNPGYPRPERSNWDRVSGLQEVRGVTNSGYLRPERINRGRLNGQEGRSVTNSRYRGPERGNWGRVNGQEGHVRRDLRTASSDDAPKPRQKPAERRAGDQKAAEHEGGEQKAGSPRNVPKPPAPVPPRHSPPLPPPAPELRNLDQFPPIGHAAFQGLTFGSFGRLP